MGLEVENGIANCPLCKEFEDCEDCPVMKKTGKMGCEGTPYDKWSSHHDKAHDGDSVLNTSTKIECSVCTRYAQQEVDFLRSLLPKGE